MTIQSLRRSLQRALLGGGAWAGVLLGWAGAAAASAQPVAPSVANQQAAPTPRNYLNLRTVKLPIQISDASRQLIREIQLHMKDNLAAAWTPREKVGPDQQEFIVQLRRDGEFWFAMVTVDRQGRSFPGDLRGLPPGLCVVLDTQAPRIDLINLGVAREGQLIQCDIHDQHLDIGKSRLFFEGGDKVFREMQAMPGKGNVYCIPAQAVFTGVIRAVAADLAGNQALAEEHLSRLRTPTTLQIGAPPTPAGPAPAPQTPNVAKPLPMSKLGNGPPEIVNIGSGSLHQTTSFPPAASIQKITWRPDGSEGPHWTVSGAADPKPTVAPQHEVARKPIAPEPLKRQLVNSTKILLEYQIENAGLSGVGKVEAWITRDKGQSWHKIAEDAQRKSPIEIHLPGDGLFGVTLVASNGRGVLGTPPATGDVPNGWIEVDRTKPSARITSVRSVTEDGKAVVHIGWVAHDNNLGEAPVDLYYAATPQGPWLPIAKGLRAEGQHRWEPPVKIGPQAHLRLIATDAAGNTAIASTLEPVLFEDLARPRAVIRSIRTSDTTTQEPPVTVAPMPVQTPPAPVQIVQPRR